MSSSHPVRSIRTEASSVPVDSPLRSSPSLAALATSIITSANGQMTSPSHFASPVRAAAAGAGKVSSSSTSSPGSVASSGSEHTAVRNFEVHRRTGRMPAIPETATSTTSAPLPLVATLLSRKTRPTNTLCGTEEVGRGAGATSLARKSPAESSSPVKDAHLLTISTRSPHPESATSSVLQRRVCFVDQRFMTQGDAPAFPSVSSPDGTLTSWDSDDSITVHVRRRTPRSHIAKPAPLLSTTSAPPFHIVVAGSHSSDLSVHFHTTPKSPKLQALITSAMRPVSPLTWVLVDYKSSYLPQELDCVKEAAKECTQTPTFSVYIVPFAREECEKFKFGHFSRLQFAIEDCLKHKEELKNLPLLKARLFLHLPELKLANPALVGLLCEKLAHHAEEGKDSEEISALLLSILHDLEFNTGFLQEKVWNGPPKTYCHIFSKEKQRLSAAFPSLALPAIELTCEAGHTILLLSSAANPSAIRFISYGFWERGMHTSSYKSEELETVKKAAKESYKDDTLSLYLAPFGKGEWERYVNRDHSHLAFTLAKILNNPEVPGDLAATKVLLSSMFGEIDPDIRVSSDILHALYLQLVTSLHGAKTPEAIVNEILALLTTKGIDTARFTAPLWVDNHRLYCHIFYAVPADSSSSALKREISCHFRRGLPRLETAVESGHSVFLHQKLTP